MVLQSAAALAALPTGVLAATPPVANIDPKFMPQWVRIKPGFQPGEIVVLAEHFFLYLVQEDNRAIRYGVALGKAGLEFTGTAEIGRKARWPNWRPTYAMIAREPQKYLKYKDGMAGGPGNPLGARALYLYRDGRDTLFRIHGTTQPQSIGQPRSNGCIRMVNEHIADLYERVPLGTTVTVI